MASNVIKYINNALLLDGMKKEMALASVLATAVISGFAIFANKFGVTGINSSVYTFARLIIVAAIMFATIFFLGNFSQLKKLSRKQWLSLAAVGLVGGSIPFLLFFRGLQLVSGPAGSFIQKTMFIFVAIVAVAFLKEKLNLGMIVGGILLLAGNFIFLQLWTQDFAWGTGHTLVLIATLFWAVENTYSKYLLRNMPGNVLAFGRMSFGSLFILVYLAFTGEIALMASLTQDQMLWILATSVILFGYVLTWYNGLKDLSVTAATSILLLGSPITTALNHFFSDAAIIPAQILGTVMILAVIIIMLVIAEKITLPFQQQSRDVS